MSYATCTVCGVEQWWSAGRGMRLADLRCTRKDGTFRCGGALRGKGGRKGTRDFVVCPCGKKRERKNTRTHDVVIRLVSGHGPTEFVEVPAGTPICRYWHQVRVHVECCGAWAASHLTIPCGAIHHFAEREPGTACGQCHHAATCCGAEGTVRR